MPKRLKYKYHLNTALPEDHSEYIFVFGSNLAGLHRTELGNIAQTYYFAETGISVGINGNSYSLPVKDRFIRWLSVEEIKKYVDQFKEYTFNQPNKKFWIPDLCFEKRGYRPYHLAPLFKGCNTNCYFPVSWKPFLK